MDLSARELDFWLSALGEAIKVMDKKGAR